MEGLPAHEMQPPSIKDLVVMGEDTPGSRPTSVHQMADEMDDVSSEYLRERSESLLLPPERILPKKGTSSDATLMHIFKGNLGTGILAMPYAFKNAGLWMGFFATLGIGATAIHCMHLLVNASTDLCKKLGKETLDYGYCIDYAFKVGPAPIRKYGRYMRKIVNLSLNITQFGFCCVYFVFMAKNMKKIIDYNALGVSVNDPRCGLKTQAYMAMILPFVIAYCCIKNLRILSYFSAFANVLCIGGLVIILFHILQDLPFTWARPSVNPNPANWPIFIATAVYAFEGIGIILPLQNKMKRPQDLLRWNGVLNTSMGIVAVLYATIGFYGYLKLGEDVEGSITLNLPSHNILFEIVKMFFVIAIFITYGLMMFVPMEIIWPMVEKKIKNKAWIKFYEFGFRSGLIVFTFVIAAIIPHLGPFISLIGALASVALALLFPVVIDTVMRLPTNNFGTGYWRLIKNVAIFIFGAVGFVAGTFCSVRDVINALQVHPGINMSIPVNCTARLTSRTLTGYTGILDLV